MKRWYAVHTQPKSEKKAEFNLNRQGYDAFCPQIRKKRRHARRLETVTVPLFPGYIFTAFDVGKQPWRPINGTFGVAYLVGSADSPAPVPEGLVEAIAARQAERGVIELPPVVFKPGEAVQMEEGPFAGLVGRFEQMKDNERVTLLLDLMGGKIPVDTHLTAISKVD